MAPSKETEDRAALLLEGTAMARWQRDAVAALVGRHAVSVTDLFIDDGERKAGRLQTLREDLREGALPWEIYRRLESWASSAETGEEGEGPTRSLPLERIDFLRGADRHRVRPASGPEGEVHFPEWAVERLADVDVAIRFGFGIVRGALLEAPTHGVLSFHHGDLREYRGRPAGFWEFLERRRSVGITVQRLTETLDGGEIAAYREVDVDDLTHWVAIRRRLLVRSEDLLAEAYAACRRGELVEPEQLGRLHSRPGAGALVRYVRRVGEVFIEESW